MFGVALESLPWRLGDESKGEAAIMGADGKPVVSRVRPEPRRPDDERQKHVAFLVSAVNAHKTMFDALVECRLYAPSIVNDDERKAMIDLCDAAIAAARGELSTEPERE